MRYSVCVRDKVYEFHYTPLRPLTGESGVTTLQTRLINPSVLGDMCTMRVLGANKKVLVEGRCALTALRAIIEEGQLTVIAKNVELGLDGVDALLTSKYPHAVFSATCPGSELRSLLAALWAEYSDF